MSLFRLEVTQSSRDRFRGRLLRLENLSTHLEEPLKRHAGAALAEIFDRNFEREGPGWRPLAEMTVRQREAQGFGGRHPILQRTGALRNSVTQRGHPQHVEEVSRQGQGRVTLSVGTSDDRAARLGEGEPESRLPARAFLVVHGGDEGDLRDALQQAVREATGGRPGR